MVVQKKQCCRQQKLGLGLLSAAARAWVSIGSSKTWLFFPFSLSWVGFFFGYCRIDGEEKDDLQRESDSGGTVVVFG